MKSFSRQFEYQSPESNAEFDHWFEKIDVFNNPFVGNPEITYSVKEIADRWQIGESIQTLSRYEKNE